MEKLKTIRTKDYEEVKRIPASEAAKLVENNDEYIYTSKSVWKRFKRKGLI